MGCRDTKARQRSKTERHVLPRSNAGKCWKFPWRRLCLAWEQRSSQRGCRTLQARQQNPTKRQSRHASWKLMNLRESVWNPLHQEIMKITSREKGCNSISHNNLAHKLIPLPQTMKSPDAKAAVDKEWEKQEKILAWQMDKVKSKKDVILEAQKEGERKPTLLHWWTSVISRMS